VAGRASAGKKLIQDCPLCRQLQSSGHFEHQIAIGDAPNRGSFDLLMV
jgi:hypothetical protein